MTSAPIELSEEQLDELGLRVVAEETVDAAAAKR
jgi:hypothetical protein